MSKLSAKNFFIACVLILMGTLAFTGLNGLKEKSSSGPSISFVQPTTTKNKKQSHARYSNQTRTSRPFMGLYFFNRTTDSHVAMYTNYEIEPLTSILKSRTAYQPISEESYALAQPAFGNSTFVGTSASTTGGKQGKAFNISSRVPTSSGVIAFVNSTAVSTPSVQNSDQADKSSSQLAEPFSDGGMPFFLPEDPGEPFPDEPVPVGSGVTFLCCCALAYIRVKFKSQKF